jgi:hypothetical protein
MDKTQIVILLAILSPFIIFFIIFKEPALLLVIFFTSICGQVLAVFMKNNNLPF